VVGPSIQTLPAKALTSAGLAEAEVVGPSIPPVPTGAVPPEVPAEVQEAVPGPRVLPAGSIMLPHEPVQVSCQDGSVVYKCPACVRTEEFKSDMIRHMRIHTVGSGMN
jgi:hypothetical protein